MESTEAKRIFQTYIQSPAGCDGGEISKSIWMFGIEYGGENDLNRDFDFSNPPQEHSEISLNYRKEFFVHQYNRKVVKLYAAMRGYPAKTYPQVFKQAHVFGKGSDTYKGNLFVLGAPRDNDKYFTESIQRQTGCATKNEYREMHEHYRFPYWHNQVTKHNPQVIVCFGRGYRRQFGAAFTPNPGKVKEIRLEGVIITYQVINEGKTLLVVCPFLGYYSSSLNSNARLEAVGRKIRELADSELHGGLQFAVPQLDIDFEVSDLEEPPAPAEVFADKVSKISEIDEKSSPEDIADILNTTVTLVQRIMDEESAITPELAIQLEEIKQLGISAENWLELQHRFNLVTLRQLKNT